MPAVSASMPRTWRRWAMVVGIALVGAAALVVLALWALQEKLIYLAPHYAPRELDTLPPGLTALRDPEDPESIVGFYRAPTDGTSLRKLWLAFGGNGSVA